MKVTAVVLPAEAFTDLGEYAVSLLTSFTWSSERFWWIIVDYNRLVFLFGGM